jgi:hypothetical protein
MELLSRKVNISIIHPRELGSGKSPRTSIPAEGAVLKVFANVLLQFSIGYSRVTCLSATPRIRW